MVQMEVEEGRGRLYKWKKGSPFKVDAQIVGDRIEEIRQKNNGIVTPEAIVEDAKDPESPLHDEFEWDVEKAAYRHWKARARSMTNHIVVVRIQSEDAEEGKPAFISVEVTQYQRGYVTLDQVVSNQDWREYAIEACFRMLKGLQKRFEALNDPDLDEIWTAIRKSEKKRAKKKKK